MLEHAGDKLIDGHELIKFTALDIIAHIENEGLCENDKSLVLAQNTFSKIQLANTPQMAAIHAAYSIEIQESPR